MKEGNKRLLWAALVCFLIFYAASRGIIGRFFSDRGKDLGRSRCYATAETMPSGSVATRRTSNRMLPSSGEGTVLMRINQPQVAGGLPEFSCLLEVHSMSTNLGTNKYF